MILFLKIVLVYYFIILIHKGNDWLSYHYYDGDRDGLPWVDIRKIEWANGWPKVTEERFSADDYFGQR